MKKNSQDNDKVIVKLKKEYLSSERKENKYKGLCIFLSIVLGASFIIILLLMNFNVASTIFGNVLDEDNTKTNEIKDILKDKWVYGNDYQDLDDTLDEKMYYGMTSFEEDPYTTYMSADDMDYFSNSIDKIQLGIGVSYYKEYNGYPYVIETFKDSGAYNAGIKKGDRLISIDGVSTLGLSDDQIKEVVLGDEGTYVLIEVLRNDQKIKYECERKYFDSTAHVSLNGDVVILTLSSFGSNTVQTISNELKDYTNYHKLIIDLRNDTGGYQDALLKIAALFLDNDTLVMKEIDKNGNETKYYADYDEHYYNFDDIVIITNENTASAAEVFAICMKEQHPNTTLLGTETFGKGVVQTSIRLKDDSYLKVTISYWTSPNGVPLKDSGIKPDIEVTLDDAFYYAKYDFPKDTIYEYDSVSSYVQFVQLMLKYLGYPISRTDGYFDISLKNAINMYKANNGLSADGKLDETTYEKIYDTFYLYDRDDQLSAALELINK